MLPAAARTARKVGRKEAARRGERLVPVMGAVMAVRDVQHRVDDHLKSLDRLPAQP